MKPTATRKIKWTGDRRASLFYYLYRILERQFAIWSTSKLFACMNLGCLENDG